MQMIKKCRNYIALFGIVLLILIGLLVATAKIPRSAIRENVLESAQYLSEHALFETLTDGIEGSKVDHYADSILLAIAYQYDADKPLESVMSSSYYYTEYQNENQNLLDAVTQELPANQEYLRYWHGSNVIVRPLLMFFNIEEIYLLNGIVLLSLSVLLVALLLKNHAVAPAIGITAGLLLTSSWVVPFSLEYTWTYLLMLLFAIGGFRLASKERWQFLGSFFLLNGMLTSYMDFLTTEILTLFIPLLLILWTDHRKNPQRPWKCFYAAAGKAVFAWCCGYIGMWVMKWLLASVILGSNAMPYVWGHVEERLGGTAFFPYLLQILDRNVGCLFPLEYGLPGVLATLGLLLGCAYVLYVYHKPQSCKKFIWLYLGICAIPYIRYLVLQNHSYLHFFFTYRAQMVTILGIALLMEETVEWSWLKGTKGSK